MKPDELFFPAIDAHNGNPPDLRAQVAVDHVLAVGSRLVQFKDAEPVSTQSAGDTSTAPTPDTTASGAPAGQDWKEVRYSDPNIAPEVQELLPKKVMGQAYHGLLPQGDFIFKTSDVRAGKFNMLRELPPGAPKS